MEEEKKKEEVETTEPEEKHEDVETKSEEETQAEPETSETTEDDKPERTPVEEAVSEAVNDGDARALADIASKLDTILNILSDTTPTFNADDSEEKHEADDKTSEAELEAYENLID